MNTEKTFGQWYLIEFALKGLTKRLHYGNNENEIRKLYRYLDTEYIIRALTFNDLTELLGLSQGEADITKLAANSPIFIKGAKEEFMIVVL